MTTETIDLPEASTLKEEELITIAGAIATTAQGRPFRKSDVEQVLIKHGFPARVHGKHYAKRHIGTLLHRLETMGFVRKSGSGMWTPNHT